MWSIAAVLALLAVLGARGDEVVVTEYGAVRGETNAVTIEGRPVRVTSFWGIPYAAPPVGNLRFEPPVKHAGWAPQELYYHSADLNMCMQSPIGLMFMTHPFWTNFEEDCLTVNIFKPEVGTGLAVLVWFHGGGYTGGGNVQYPGHFLAARDTVVVTVNYRLGVFGFANTPDGTIRGNMGMLDQTLALEFVRDNIASFGGNPNRVTIFGQSAGASSAALHLISPRSRGLAHQAILESGAENNVWSLNYPSQTPENYIYQVAEKVNCIRDTDAQMVNCLKLVPRQLLRIADSIDCTPGYFCQGFAPIVDGPGGFMPDMPLKLREELGAGSVPIIAGHCKDDGSLYTLYFIPEADRGGFTREEFQDLLRTRLADIFYAAAESDEIYENGYQAVQYYYTPWPYIDDEEANRQGFNKLLTDAAFGFPWDRNAKLNSEHASTFTYIQAFRSPNATSFIPEWMGVPHNGELPYVWGYGYLLINEAVRDDSGIHFDILGWVPEDMVYADFVQTLWTNFAKYGQPTPTPLRDPFNETSTVWQQYSPADNHKVLFLDGSISTKENYRQQDYAFFTQYMSYVTKHDVLRTEKKPSAVQYKTRPKFQLKSSMFQEAITRMAIKTVRSHNPEKFDQQLKEFMAKMDL